MSTVIVVDSACDLPEKFSQSKSIQVLPINIELGEKKMLDTFDSDQVLALIKSGEMDPKLYANSDAATKEQIIEFVKNVILPNFDHAIVQTVAGSKSSQFDLWQEVNSGLSNRFEELRKPGRKAFQMNIIDSGTAYSGQGLLALETVRLAKLGSHNRRDLIKEIRDFTQYIQGYSAPPDLGYIRKRGVQRGDNALSLFNTMLGKVLNISPILYGMKNEVGLAYREKGHDNAINRILAHAIAGIKEGLLSPIINMSYAGNLDDLKKFELYRELLATAKTHKVMVFTSVARLSTAINLGPGNFSLSLATKDPTFIISEK